MISDFIPYQQILNNQIFWTLESCELIYYKQKRYINCPCSFDIETSSFIENGEKRSIMYIWSFDLNGLCIYGRTWEEFIELLERIKKCCGLNNNVRLVCYVHNLAYEFQFMRHWVSPTKVFARKSRKPIYIESAYGIDFRCSYMLSGYSLAKVAENLTKYKIEKKIGDLDYNLIRTSKTELTDEELGYCLNDIKIIEYYIREEIENCGNITKIPLTQTGYVRKYVRESLKKNKLAMQIIHDLQITDIYEYDMLKDAFQGGFTHANCLYVGQTVENVHSIDFTSSYPSVLISEKYPFSKPEIYDKLTYEEYNTMRKDKLIIGEIEILGLEARYDFEAIISESKCLEKENTIVNNGRVMKADRIVTRITNIDFDSIEKFYRWDAIVFKKSYVYEKAYLPKEFIKSVLKFFHDKQTLKHNEEKQVEYMKSKQMLNSMYGMMVTDIMPKEVGYEDGEWVDKGFDIMQLYKYNDSKNRFLYYPWGVFVTAYARRNLYDGILNIGSDYIYSDTDSIKFINYDSHKQYILDYNQRIIKKLNEALEHYKIDLDELHPNGRYLGIWDYEGMYTKFKSLGAKRYIYEQDGKIHVTIAGVGKKSGSEYLNNCKNPFEMFNEYLTIPKEYSGKLVMTYIDEETSGVVTDYLGNESAYHEKSSVHLGMSEYSLGLSKDFINFLNNIESWRFSYE